MSRGAALNPALYAILAASNIIPTMVYLRQQQRGLQLAPNKTDHLLSPPFFLTASHSKHCVDFGGEHLWPHEDNLIPVTTAASLQYPLLLLVRH